MARLDDAAADVLEALTAQSMLWPPNKDQAATIALWLVKIGMAYDLFLPTAEKAYTDTLRLELFETREVPSGTTVFLGYQPDQPEWLSFWQRGWRIAPPETPAAHIVAGAPNLSTTFMAILGHRLVAHRISPELPALVQAAAALWLDEKMDRSRMVPIAPLFDGAPREAMDDRAVEVGRKALHQFVDRNTSFVAPYEKP